ncbi:MAG: hypothetical protein LC437_06375 [Thiohalomonas sp.]|nr:hypothetical protein [Thiohalomonas sp.]
MQANSRGVYSGYDTDSDGYFDRMEYEQLYESKRKYSKNLDNWIFDTLDSDDDNKISQLEMLDALIKNMKRKKQK